MHSGRDFGIKKWVEAGRILRCIMGKKILDFIGGSGNFRNDSGEGQRR